MPYKLAITVAGAVSLGAYEAGVLYEILDAIGQHNQHPATRPEQQIIVDVLTGASAGGISATVLAQKLLFEADALSGPYTNILYRAWVQDLQFEPLMNLQSFEDPSHSILSSALVDALSKKYLTQRYASHIPPASVAHPAAGTRIRLGLALANLNGVDYEYPQRPQGTFTYTRFQDQMQATVDAGSDNVDFWDALRKAAISCSAFPFAFRVKDLARHRTEYDSPNVVFPLPVETFTYTDGGTFENQPIGLAKQLVDVEDPGHRDSSSRFYLFISPHSKSSETNSTFNERSGNFLALLMRIVPAIFGQAGFQDWIEAEQVNARVRLFNSRAEALKMVMLNPPRLAPGPLQAAASELLPLLFANRQAGEETLDEARARLKQQFHQEYTDLSVGIDAATANTWIDSILALETAADLGNRDEMIIYGITADSSELAGAGFQAFLGFFEQDYRDHDYDVGRAKAQRFLASLQQNPVPNGLPPLNFVAKALREMNHGLDGLALEDVPPSLRQNMLDRLEDRANDLLQEANINVVEREAIKLFLIRPQLKKLLQL